MSAAVYEALTAHVAANWTHTPIRLPNGTADQPADGSAWLDVQFPLAREDNVTIGGGPGNNWWREGGGLVLSLMIPIGTEVNGASEPWLERLDALRATLRGQNIDGVVTWEASPVVIGETNDHGSHFELSFAVEWENDILG